MKFLVLVVLVCLAVTVYGQGQQAAASAATAGAPAQAGAARGRGGLGGLLTLGVLTGGMGGDAMRDMMYCNMLGINPIFCMAGM